MARTFPRPNLFMQGLLLLAPLVLATGRLAAPAGTAAVSLVDVRDNAAVAALTGRGHEGRTYTLTGPEALTHAEVAASLTAATGRPVAYHDASEAEMRAGLLAAGMDPWMAEGLIEDYAHCRRGEAAEVHRGVEEATGQASRHFADFARENARAFAEG